MKGIVFIYGKEIILRFFSTNAFNDLSKQHELIYAALKSSSLMKEGGVDENIITEGLPKIEWIPFYPGRFEKWSQLFDTSCMLFQERSASFRTRYQESAKVNPKRYGRLSKLTTAESYPSYREAQEERMGLHPDILELTYRERPDFFILPSAILDYCTDDVLQIANKMKIPTIMLVAGWDNLSSKGLLYHLPSVMGVWGEQNRRHAVEIQKMPPENVFIIGAPQYDDFKSIKNNKTALRKALGLPGRGKTILFAGTFRLFDETQLLKEIDQSIEDGIFPHLNILYRPHPWRVKRKSEEDFFSQSWRHIWMDPEIERTYKIAKATGKSATPNDFGFRMKHLINIYQAVDAVISPMSTVLLEAMLFGLPVQAVAFNDGKHSWSADKVSTMEHFKELFSIPYLLVCRKRKDFLPQMKQLIELSGSKEIKTGIIKSTKELLYRDRKSYAQRIANLIKITLMKISEKPNYDKSYFLPGKTYSPNFIKKCWESEKSIIRKTLRILKDKIC